MTPQQVNLITAIVAVVLVVILFVLVAMGILPSLIAILLTVGIGAVASAIRKRAIKP